MDDAIYSVETPHGTGFFMGEVSDGNYGPSYYPVIMLVRSTPVALFFSLACLIFQGYRIKKNGVSREEKTLVLISLFIVLFAAQMTLVSKKGDRYLLPLFPFIDVLAGAGLFYVSRGIAGTVPLDSLKVKFDVKRVSAIIFAVVVLYQAISLASVHPYYLAYFNPAVFGGPANADKIVDVGWGEGMDLAAKYMNEKPGAENLTVAQQYVGFREFFKGKTVDMKDVDSADYIVFYVSAVQRDWNKDIWDKYRNTTPEKVIVINGIEYCWIYEKT